MFYVSISKDGIKFARETLTIEVIIDSNVSSKHPSGKMLAGIFNFESGTAMYNFGLFKCTAVAHQPRS